MFDVNKIGKIYVPLISGAEDYALWLDILKRVLFLTLLMKNWLTIVNIVYLQQVINGNTY